MLKDDFHEYLLVLFGIVSRWIIPFQHAFIWFYPLGLHPILCLIKTHEIFPFFDEYNVFTEAIRSHQLLCLFIFVSALCYMCFLNNFPFDDVPFPYVVPQLLLVNPHEKISSISSIFFSIHPSQIVPFHESVIHIFSYVVSKLLLINSYENKSMLLFKDVFLDFCINPSLLIRLLQNTTPWFFLINHCGRVCIRIHYISCHSIP